MPTLFSLVVLAAAFVYLVILVVEAFRQGLSKRWGLELAIIPIALLGLHWLTGFPAPPQRTSFGAGSDAVAVALMFTFVLLGMVARYVFYRRGPFRWDSFLKPFCVSPFSLAPLIGVFPFGYELSVQQGVYFAFLAFQNGFFWKAYFERAKNST